MSSIPNRPRITDLQRRIMGEVNIKPFHTHAYAESAYGSQLGAADSKSFSQRRQIEGNRRVVRSYRDAMVTHAPEHTSGQSLSPGAPRPAQSGRQSYGMGPRTNFHRPTTRGFDPYR